MCAPSDFRCLVNKLMKDVNNSNLKQEKGAIDQNIIHGLSPFERGKVLRISASSKRLHKVRYIDNNGNESRYDQKVKVFVDHDHIRLALHVVSDPEEAAEKEGRNSEPLDAQEKVGPPVSPSQPKVAGECHSKAGREVGKNSNFLYPPDHLLALTEIFLHEDRLYHDREGPKAHREEPGAKCVAAVVQDVEKRKQHALGMQIVSLLIFANIDAARISFIHFDLYLQNEIRHSDPRTAAQHEQHAHKRYKIEPCIFEHPHQGQDVQY